jgi:hypothetical protein
MGTVTDLRRWRAQRERTAAARSVVTVDAVRRLERAVRRLDPAVANVAAPDGTVDPRIETELLAITGAVSIGETDQALERAERLADRLEHPAAGRPR